MTERMGDRGDGPNAELEIHEAPHRDDRRELQVRRGVALPDRPRALHGHRVDAEKPQPEVESYPIVEALADHALEALRDDARPDQPVRAQRMILVRRGPAEHVDAGVVDEIARL